MAALAEEEAIRFIRARKVKDLDGVYDQVIRDLGTVYSIGYRPSNRGAKAYGIVNVRVVGHTDLALRAKRGYYEASSRVLNSQVASNWSSDK